MNQTKDMKKWIYPLVIVLVGILSMGITVFARSSAESERPELATAMIASADDRMIGSRIAEHLSVYIDTTYGEDINETPVIEEAAAVTPRMVLRLTEDEIYMLACQVTAEAGNEPYDCMIGIANVIINRVKSSRFPNTIRGVIYQAGQFPPAYTGVLDRIMRNGPYQACINATYDALYGASTVGDYLFFNMQSGVNTGACSRWMRLGTTIFYMP